MLLYTPFQCAANGTFAFKYAFPSAWLSTHYRSTARRKENIIHKLDSAPTAFRVRQRVLECSMRVCGFEIIICEPCV